jgi:hypothetical protein
VCSVSPQEGLTGDKPQLLAYLIQWDIISIVGIRKKINGKWREQSIKIIMVGGMLIDMSPLCTVPAAQSKLKKGVESQDVTWLTWNHLDPKKDMSIFRKDLEKLENVLDQI